MALDFPLSSFVGVDISPLFPEERPPNAAFIKCDVHDGLPFPDNSFDFVWQAFLIVCIDWQAWREKVMKELIRVTKPGGYIEIMDMDAMVMNPGEIGRKLNQLRKYIYIYIYMLGVAEFFLLNRIIYIFRIDELC